jgi:Leucine-rich repeat (LRR) protein
MEKEKNTQNETKKLLSRKNKLSDAAIALLLISVSVFIFFVHKQKPDLTSEKIIREAIALQLNKDPNMLIDEDYAKISELVLSRKKLFNIKLLEKCTNLQKLELSWISYPEKKIPKWKKILKKYRLHSIFRLYEIDLRPLNKLISLQDIRLDGYYFHNIKPLAGLTNLKRLRLTNTRVYDLEPLKNLTQLQVLFLYDCENITCDEETELKQALPNLKVIKRISPKIRF